MNCLHYILHWLFPSGAVVAEWVVAIATGCLVLAGFIQLNAIRKGAEEQRARWKREDELRAEENMPKAVFWLDQRRNNSSPELWCANTGTVNFLVSGMQVNPLLGEPKRIPFRPRNFFVVPVGGMKSIDLSDPEVLFGSNRPGNAEIKLVLQGPSGEIESSAKAYHLWFHTGRYIMEEPERGFQSLQPLQCSKCGTMVANFSVEGMTSIDECTKEITHVEREFEATCPNHTSANVRVCKPTAA